MKDKAEAPKVENRTESPWVRRAREAKEAANRGEIRRVAVKAY